MTCWKCQAPLRSAEARFCPNCGAATQGVTPPDDWRKRIDAAGQTGAGWRLVAKILLVLLSFCGLLLYPIFFVRNRRRLSRHIADHLVSPRFEAGRFQATPEGQNILARLQQLAGSPRALGIPTAAFLYCFILLPLGILFIGPTFAPAHIDYDRALEEILECSSTRGYISVHSKSDYEDTLDYLKYQYDHAYINYNQASGDNGYNLPSSEYYSGPNVEWHRKPYEYLHTYGGRSTVYRASSIDFYWTGSEALGVFFYIALSLMALVLMIAHIRHWVRFARHRAVEVLAASYLRGDVRYHDELMADVRGRNAGLTFAVIALTLSQFHLLAFPFMAPWMLRWHIEWEERVGIDRALGTAISPT